MKPRQFENLLRAVKAKRQLEEARAAAVRRAQAALAREADAFEAEIAPLCGDGGETSGAELGAYARRLAWADRAACERREAVKLLDPQKHARECALRRSLSEENAWKRLREDQRAEAKKTAENRDEEAREAASRLQKKPS